MPPSSRDPEISGVQIESRFVRYRNVLVTEADFTGLFVDYYLHLVDHGLQVQPDGDDIFKQGLTAFTLHCASRPRNEMVAWTINFQTPLLNVFLAGDNGPSTVTGRIFEENVRVAEHGLFFSDVVRGRSPVHRSTISFPGGSPFQVVESYYRQSEQRIARFIHLGGDRIMLLTSHPDCDLNWLTRTTEDELRELDKRETLAPIERRTYSWSCGCSQQKILKVLAPTMRSDPDGLFAGDESLRLNCPR